MKKIEITQEIINKHRDYYSNNILPLFGEYEKKVQFNDSSYKNKHVAFLKFCKDNYEKFAIGEPKELMKLLNEIETNHSTVLKMIKDRIKCEFTSVEKPYNEVLLEMFGYNKFIDSNSVEILKRAVRSVKRINKTSEVRARVLEKIRGVVQIDNFDERISRINNDTELKEFFKKNIKRDFTLRDYKDFSVLSECWNEIGRAHV